MCRRKRGDIASHCAFLNYIAALLDLDINIRDFNIPSYVHLYIFTEVYFHDQMIPSFLMEKQINFAGI